MNRFHIPVMLKEVIKYLSPGEDKYIVDGTCGSAGHTKAILEAFGEGTRVLALDMDPDAVRVSRQVLSGYGKRVDVVKCGYHHMDRWMERPADGILLDLGVSSHQIDSPERGFGFQVDGPLDMRIDYESDDPTAEELLNTLSREQLAKIIRDFGEERRAGKIAGNIVRARSERKLRTTSELARIVEKSVPPPFTVKAKARVFQAFRIAVNRELEKLDLFLDSLERVLAPGGVVVIISFHSLEDRRVKRAFVSGEKGCICPPDFPECVCGRKPFLRRLNRKVVLADEGEKQANPRARSAKLRAAERLG